MYHYLKWAALSLFFKRNLRYLLFIAVGFIGIYISDAIYTDMAEYALMTEQTEDISRYLLLKWIAVACFALLIVWSIFRLGFVRKKEEKKRKVDKSNLENDPYMKRLEKFRTPRKLRSKSQLLIEKKRKKGK